MDLDGVKHSVEITAGSLFEAARNRHERHEGADWFNRSTLTIEIRVALRLIGGFLFFFALFRQWLLWKIDVHAVEQHGGKP
jgi:hypothetical protein